MAGRLALLQYVEKTHTKLRDAAKMNAAELRSKVMPSVVESIHRLAAGAPPTFKHQLYAFLTETGVLPDFDADMEAFKCSLLSISKFIQATFREDEESKSPLEEPRTVNCEPEAFPANEKEDEPTPIELQHSCLQPQEAAPMEDRTMPTIQEHGQLTGKETGNETGKETGNDLQSQGTPVKETVATQVEITPKKEALLSKVMMSRKGDHSSRTQLLNYIDSTLSRLETTGNIGGTQLRTKVLPSVIAGIERLTVGAPPQIKSGIKDVLQKSGVVPVWAADVECLKLALGGIRSLIEGCDQCPTETSLGHALRGVSVAYLSTTFLDEVKAHGFDRTAKVYEIEAAVIRGKGKDVTCPRDKQLGAAFIDCLSESDAGISTHMLSYTWGYEIGDIVDSLLAFCRNKKLRPENVFVWICCLCINQHRVIEARERGDVVPFEEFKAAFGHRVSSIGHIVAMMSPWKDPSYTKRVWCDFEMYTAASLGEDVCKVSVTMPPREANDMRMTLMSGGASNPDLWEALQNVKIEEAQASVPEDKDCILKLIEGTIGFHALNSTVTKCLQSWIASTCEEIYEELSADRDRSEEEIAKTAASVGYVLRDIGNHEKALAVLMRAQDLFEDAGIIDTHDGAMLLSNLGATHRRCGDLQRCLEVLTHAQQIFVRTGTLDTVAGAMLCNTLGAARRQANDISGAIDVFDTAHAILQRLDALQTSEASSVMNSYGALKRQIGDLDGALDAFKVAEAALVHSKKMNTPAGHVLMNSIAITKRNKNDMQGALEAYASCRHILERIGNLESDNGLSLLNNIGATKRKVKDFQGALEAFMSARDVCQKLNKMHTPEARNLMQSIAELEAKGGRKGKAHGKGYGKGKMEEGRVARGYYASKGNSDITKGSQGGKGVNVGSVQGEEMEKGNVKLSRQLDAMKQFVLMQATPARNLESSKNASEVDKA